VRPAINEEEKQLGKWLNAPIFLGGLEPDALVKALKQSKDVPASELALAEQASREGSRLGAERRLWFDEFTGEACESKTPEETRARGATLLSSLKLRGLRTASQGSEVENHPAVRRALAYARLALIKQLGLVREAMTFSRVLAAQHADCDLSEGLFLRPQELPASLRRVWLAVHDLKDWITKRRQELFSAGQNETEANSADGQNAKPKDIYDEICGDLIGRLQFLLGIVPLNPEPLSLTSAVAGCVVSCREPSAVIAFSLQADIFSSRCFH